MLEPRFPLAKVQNSRAIAGSNPVFPSPKYKTYKPLRARTPFRQGLVKNCARFLLKSSRFLWGPPLSCRTKDHHDYAAKIGKNISEQNPRARWPLRLSPGPFLSPGNPERVLAPPAGALKTYVGPRFATNAKNSATKMVLEPRFPLAVLKK